MITGTFTVETSDNADLVAGSSYPLSIDDTTIDVSVVTTSIVTATGIAPAIPPGATVYPINGTDGTSAAVGDNGSTAPATA